MKKICVPLMLTLSLILYLGFLTTPAQAAESDFVIENGVLVQYNGPGGDVVIPDGVTSIGGEDFPGFSGMYAFGNCASLTGVVIPNSVTKIGYGAFCNCPNLTSIVIPDSVTSIGDSAFSGCTSLTSVTISNRVTVIGNQAFVGCIGLTNIVVPDSVTKIGWTAFAGCTNLTSVIISSSATEMDGFIFKGCTSLKHITAPTGSSFTLFGYRPDSEDGDIESVESVESITITGPIVSLGFVGDCGYVNLKEVSAPNAKEMDISYPFQGCTNLKSVSLPNVEKISSHAFYGCTSLENVSIPNAVEICDYAFLDCTNLKSVSLPNVEKIGLRPFYGCKSLENVSLPNVEKIGSYTFYGCTSLENVSIPNAAEICDYAFWDCTNLKNVFAPCVTKIEGRPFLGCTDPQLIVYGVQGTDYYSYVMSHWATTAYANGVGLGNYVSPQSETITAQSNQICAGLTTDYEKARAIYAWMAENVAYDHDYYERRKDTVITDPEGVLESKLTVCAGYAKLTQALMQAQGIPTMYITGPADGAKGWELHAWNAAYIREQGRWIYLDSTWGRSRQWVRDDDELHLTTETSFDYFDISPYVLATDHHADPIAQNSFSVLPNRSTVLVNGKKVDFESYNICGNNYFKLRDLAAALNGSEKQFDVTWDSKNKMVNLVSDHAYTAIGGELTPGDGKVKQAQVNGSSACFNGMQFMLPSYNIGGSNYVKLRDIANMLDFGVSWDNENKTVVIDSSTGYTG